MATVSALILPIGLAIAALLFAVFVLKLPRTAITALAAALVFGLAGYAWQGAPGLAGSPTITAQISQNEGEQLVSMRREVLADRYWSRNSGALIPADAMARRGRFSDAAVLYRGMATTNPNASEAWLALGNALIAHAGGAMTPAAAVAFRRAEAAAPESAGVPFFFGLVMLQAGEVMQGRAAWEEALGRMEPGEENHATMALRLERLDNLITQFSAEQQAQAQQAPDSQAETPENRIRPAQ